MTGSNARTYFYTNTHCFFLFLACSCFLASCHKGYLKSQQTLATWQHLVNRSIHRNVCLTGRGKLFLQVGYVSRVKHQFQRKSNKEPFQYFSLLRSVCCVIMTIPAVYCIVKIPVEAVAVNMNTGNTESCLELQSGSSMTQVHCICRFYHTFWRAFVLQRRSKSRLQHCRSADNSKAKTIFVHKATAQ